MLDPTRDGHTDINGEYFVVAVAPEGSTSDTIYAEATASSASTTASAAASTITVDGHAWNGNASIIANTSGTATGYGLTKDETMIHPGDDPVVFFQWEIDTDDGTQLEIDADGMTATIQYGVWNGDRSKDITRTVSLPATIDPAADGLSAADGEYYVIAVRFADAPSQSTAVTAEVK